MTDKKSTAKKRSIFSVASVSAPVLVSILMVLTRISGNIVNSNSNSENLFLTVSVVNVIIFILPAAIYYLLSGRKLHSQIFISGIKSKYIIFIIFVSLMFLCGNLLIKYFFYDILGITVKATGYIEASSLEGHAKSSIVIALCIVPAICEELIFRGVVLTEYRHYGAFNAVFISSLGFAMMHFSFSEFIPVFFSGVILGFMTLICRSVFPAMLLHALNNYINIFGNSAFIRIIASQSGVYFVTFILISIFVFSLIVVLSRLEHVYYLYSENPPVSMLPPKSNEHLFAVYCSPTFYLMLVVFVIITLL